MADAMQGLVSEAKKNKFSTLANTLSDDDVVSVWDNVSGFIEKQMSAQKGVNITGLGTFTFSQKKLDVGNNKFILIQRPVFILSEKFAQVHGLNCTKHHTTGTIPIVQLNFSALSHESPFDRDTVEACVKEVMQALGRSVAARRNVEFSFTGIGRLQIRDSKVKMKFYKDFINSMDGSGRLMEALKDRPGTVDSVMSDRSTPARPGTSTLILPRISNGGLALGPSDACMPTIREEAAEPHAPHPQPVPMEGDELTPNEEAEAKMTPVEGLAAPDPDPADEYDIGMKPQTDGMELDSILGSDDGRLPGEPKPSPSFGQRVGSRMAVPMAQASGVSFAEDLMPQQAMRGTTRRSLSPIHLPHSATLRASVDMVDRPDYRRSMSVDRLMESGGKLQPTPPPPKGMTPQATRKPPTSSCGHKDAGQELCYLCHQRDRMNIPVSFTNERKTREKEEDRLLQQYQHMKDSEAIIQEQDVMHIKRYDNQNMAAFNLGVSEAINQKKHSRPTDFHPSYIFQKRPLTPPRFIKQEMYHNDLAQQVVSKDDALKKRRADEEFLERLEQVQLAEDLSAQREQYLKEKSEQQEQYKRALSAQIQIRDSVQGKDRPRIRQSCRLGPLTLPLTLPRPQMIVPFQQTQTIAVQEGPNPLKRTVRFKPMQLPARVPDSSEPVFGKFDMTNEAMAERRRRAHDLYKEQLTTVESRKREAILRRLGEQKEEEDMLHRTKHELLDDRANRYERMFSTRKRLEDDWFRSRDLKKAKEQDEKERSRSPGALLHEQCDKYDRCGQCKRRVGNCGESNIWRESRYIPGSRLMV